VNRKYGLGKGLGALIPEESLEEANSSPMKISINLIKANDEQPRTYFDEEKIQILADSIVEHGIIQPLILRKEGDIYIIIAGERRWRAAKVAGLKEVPAVVMDVDDKELLEISLIENIQREDLNPVEEALAYKRLLEEFKLTQEELSKRVGKSRSAVTNCMRLLNLDQRVLQYLKEDVITEGHGRALVVIKDGDIQLNFAKEIIDKGLSVREVEKRINTFNKPLKEKLVKKDDTYCLDIKNRLENYFSTRVSVLNNNNKGKIEIEYYSGEDLDRILELLRINQ